MSDHSVSTISRLGTTENGELILLANEVLGYFDRSAGFQRSLQILIRASYIRACPTSRAFAYLCFCVDGGIQVTPVLA